VEASLRRLRLLVLYPRFMTAAECQLAQTAPKKLLVVLSLRYNRLAECCFWMHSIRCSISELSQCSAGWLSDHS